MTNGQIRYERVVRMAAGARLSRPRLRAGRRHALHHYRHPAPEGEERVRIRAGADEPLRVEERRTGPQVGPAVGQVDAGRRNRPGGQVAAADARRRLEAAADLGDHRAQPGRLLDDRIEVLETPNVLGLERPVTGDRAE